ncbi:hypothetical protein GBAR_LOCUS19295 [Geodia barretti]|uniref:Uncharacterized protein n=1 Tax=Geodia barretti TaxID=519541 RepID=A0AA35ST44_GEOBA|nr:hypothetical protein GBAR_LOCUS19295 [Geodia barretti]
MLGSISRGRLYVTNSVLHCQSNSSLLNLSFLSSLVLLVLLLISSLLLSLPPLFPPSFPPFLSPFRSPFLPLAGMSFSYSKSSELNGYAAMTVVPDTRLSDEECETAVISSPTHYPHSTPLSPHYITSPSSSSLSSVTSPGLECPPLPFRPSEPTVNREPLSSFSLLSSGHHPQPPQLLPQSLYTHQHHHPHTHHR